MRQYKGAEQLLVQPGHERAREEAELEALRREVLENRVVPGAADAAVRGTDDAAVRSVAEILEEGGEYGSAFRLVGPSDD